MTVKERILEYIKAKKNVNQKRLTQISQAATSYNEFKRLLIENNFTDEEELLLLFSKELKIPFLDLKKYKIPPNTRDLLSEDIVFKYKVLPLCKIGAALTLVTANPLDIIAYDDIRIISGTEKIDLVLSREEDIMKALDSLYKGGEDISKVIDETTDAEFDIDLEDEHDTGSDLESLISESKRPPIVRAIDLIVYNGLKKRASDIHIEPYEDKLLVKYRIDGVLIEDFSFPKKNQSAVIARLKIIANLDITDSRLPQDGRFKVKFENREIDFRVSSLPTNFGEKFVLRVLDKDSLSIGLKKLGFSQKPMELFEAAVAAPFGIILVTGPTGSGKSTTLYSIINQINDPERNIITIEEPVEYHLEGITQIQVNSDIGLTFAAGLRSVLRQSPDVIMVGEIRDTETADIAIKASLTGEIILSTLHTNNAVGSVTRLRDMGVEPFLLASSLVALTAQRLVRTLCPKCKEKYIIDNDTVKTLGIEYFCKENKNVREFYKAKGCAYCNQIGYRGRVAIIEIILLDDIIREMIIDEKPESDIVDYAAKNRGFKSLQEDGLAKCVEGLTTIEEIIRVTSES
jgi:type IV pilus assembly protein PilB